MATMLTKPVKITPTNNICFDDENINS